jgi:hypothetical protein
LANADSGATGNYLALADISVLRDVRISSVSEQISVSVANGTQLRSTHHGYVDVPEHGAMLAHIFPQLKIYIFLNSNAVFHFLNYEVGILVACGMQSSSIIVTN